MHVFKYVEISSHIIYLLMCAESVLTFKHSLHKHLSSGNGNAHLLTTITYFKFIMLFIKYRLFHYCKTLYIHLIQHPFTYGLPTSSMAQVSCSLSPPCTPVLTVCLSPCLPSCYGHAPCLGPSGLAVAGSLI